MKKGFSPIFRAVTLMATSTLALSGSSTEATLSMLPVAVGLARANQNTNAITTATAASAIPNAEAGGSTHFGVSYSWPSAGMSGRFAGLPAGGLGLFWGEFDGVLGCGVNSFSDIFSTPDTTERIVRARVPNYFRPASWPSRTFRPARCSAHPL